MKSRIDSDNERTAIMNSVTRRIEPPAHMTLTHKERKHFYAVTQELAKSELSPMLLEICALIAYNLAALDHQKSLLRQESTTILMPNGRTVPNARISIIRGLTCDVVKLRTHLLSAGVEAKGQRKQRTTAKMMEADAETIFGEELINATIKHKQLSNGGDQP